MFLGLPDSYPFPLVRGTDPWIRIRTKISGIPDTESSTGIFSIQIPAVGAGRAAVERETQRPSGQQEERQQPRQEQEMN
jgi:hypothetical protein